MKDRSSKQSKLDPENIISAELEKNQKLSNCTRQAIACPVTP